MRDGFSKLFESKTVRLLIIWHFLSVVFSLIIGFFDGNYSLFISLFVWSIIAVVAYKLEPKFYIVSSMILSTIEEWLVYQFGGGLQGEAQSLFHDFINALPIFLGLAVGWYLVLKRYEISEPSIYVMSALHAAFIELLFQGIIFNPVQLFLLGGPSMFIYASIFLSPELPKGKKEANMMTKFIMWIMIVFFMILGAIVADNLNQAYGFS